MTKLGAYAAKTHFSALLERVMKGERIAITKHGVPVAYLVPATGISASARRSAIEELKTFGRRRKASAAEIREWIEEGRS